MSEGFCYVAKAPSVPGAYAACADMADMPKETAKFVSAELRRGAVVERVPTQQARDLLGEFMKWQTAEKERTGKHPKLFPRKRTQ